VRETLFAIEQRLRSGWARLRHRARFDEVQRFCLFLGYPRSGHSLVGALLNAHRQAVISHELDAPALILAGCDRDTLYSRILARAASFDARGNRSNYDYQVPDQWQGRFESLRVIGDKRGGAMTRALGANPDLLARTRKLVGVPVRLVHVVRNPFDNIAAISLWHGMTLEESADYYFMHCRITAAVEELADPETAQTVVHEEMIGSPVLVLRRLGALLGLDMDPDYLESCRRVVFPAPTYTRRKVSWPATLVADVARRAERFAFLAGYEFEAPDGADATDTGDVGLSARS
jgi:hypothetical protein